MKNNIIVNENFNQITKKTEYSYLFNDKIFFTSNKKRCINSEMVKVNLQRSIKRGFIIANF
jgi:hypothetical protein